MRQRDSILKGTTKGLMGSTYKTDVKEVRLSRPLQRKAPERELARVLPKKTQGRPKLMRSDKVRKSEHSKLTFDQFIQGMKVANSMSHLKMRQIGEVLKKNGLPEYQASNQNIYNVFKPDPKRGPTKEMLLAMEKALECPEQRCLLAATILSSKKRNVKEAPPKWKHRPSRI